MKSLSFDRVVILWQFGFSEHKEHALGFCLLSCGTQECIVICDINNDSPLILLVVARNTAGANFLPVTTVYLHIIITYQRPPEYGCIFTKESLIKS
jgi:hypothetical protein